MTNRRTARWVKGVAVSAVSAVGCYEIWTSCREWAFGVAAADQDALLGGGFLELLLAGVAGVLSMPLLLWAGMRVLRERGNHLLVMIGAMTWIFLGGHVVEDGVGTVPVAGFLTLFAALGGLLSWVRTQAE
ncbi:hypothetical protein ACIOEW_33830 [Streptomyces sp. NPDC087901]|uniref:hypothetical protein n=1 Tax=unclassified Streptomyces TaxID=2593676 RepID=UPI003433EF5D